jgi:hypothetical protein
MKRDMSYLRTYNVIENYTEPIGKMKDALTGKTIDRFRQFTIKDAQFENGKTGKKIIQFSKTSLSDAEEEDLHKWEDLQSKLGKPVRVRVINTEELRKFPLFWYFAVSSKEKDSSMLQRAMFNVR